MMGLTDTQILNLSIVKKKIHDERVRAIEATFRQIMGVYSELYNGCQVKNIMYDLEEEDLSEGER